MTEYETEQCRSCPDLIIWTVTAAGKPMPVDAEPAAGGNLALTVDDKGVVRSRVVARHLTFGRRDLRLSHFVKCKDAAKWRRR
jgi:hypothetical protein